MVALLKSGDGNIAAIITVEQHTNKVDRIDTIDLAHAFNGRLVKKEGSESSARERGYANSALPAITTFKASIADVLKIVNTTHQSMLGYNDLRDPSVSGFFRFLARVGDHRMKMQIVKIGFKNQQPK